jgi:coenzyme F420-0:L-glutamate ligase/coenzyme F420-1:gamma-L-glutamate ligase
LGALTLTPLEGLPLIQPGDDLAALLLESLARASIRLTDGDILVLAQKIISKAEERFAHLDDVQPGAEAEKLAAQVEKDPRLVQLILDESTAWALSAPMQVSIIPMWEARSRCCCCRRTRMPRRLVFGK